MTSDLAPDRAYEYVQPIVLLVDRVDPAAELDGITAVAAASVAAYARDMVSGRDIADWDLWLSGPFAKSVRRADRKAFDKVRAEFGDDATAVRVGDGEALAFRPLPAALMPRTLARLQVSGTSLPKRLASVNEQSTTTVILNDDLDMTTGKAAAQAAHALFAWVLDHGTPGATPTIRFASRSAINALLAAHPDSVVIEDAGRTEIEPGSLTAIAF